MVKDGLWTDGLPWLTMDGTMVPLSTADIPAPTERVLRYTMAVSARAMRLAARLKMSEDPSRGFRRLAGPWQRWARPVEETAP